MLFDSSASHSFISAKFARKHSLKIESSNQEWHVNMPTGKTQISRLIIRRNPLENYPWNLEADFIVMDIQEFDIIYGMDWLSEHHAHIDCRNKKIMFNIPNRRRFYF